MDEKINLYKLEKNTAGLIYKTGIVDVSLGMVFIVISMAMIFDDIRYYIDIALITPIIFISLSTKYIVKPRMGVVVHSRKRIKRSLWLIASVTTFLLIMSSFTLFGSGGQIEEVINPRWIISGIIFFICIAIAFFLNFSRMYLYSVIYIAAFNGSEFLRENPGILPSNGYAYLIASGIIMIIGLYYFTHFLKEYPLPDEGTDYEG